MKRNKLQLRHYKRAVPLLDFWGPKHNSVLFCFTFLALFSLLWVDSCFGGRGHMSYTTFTFACYRKYIPSCLHSTVKCYFNHF